ncbi:SusD/RagB family nutrient-binding outer membrane lipoprotein [Larkinella humicola]|uniref:SusD/RagB family nutrient-binding outer membrane lipoprotein n=1 Tax=Larkinella humicola TaxID=2607654 RepID=A0A5N1JCD6_9BACT|nr:SusD/RagB family nutrient-binding outer membrane lipoprotein [Larkinella humicola]KAA9352939.1 SusD/RagB family nutrient-binding outer membrane lipoprotein [Larkinella humicola]
MKKLLYTSLLATGLFFSSCSSYLDVNDDPNNIQRVQVSQLLPSVTVNIGYMGASDLFRYASLLSQQFSGQGPNTGFGTFKEYERYNINDSDVNGQWVRIFGTTVSDLELMIAQATREGSPHYAGVGKILKAYVYQIVVDAWGDVPYTQAGKHSENFYPAFDDDEVIYKDLTRLIDEGLTDVNAATSALSPNQFSTIYSGTTWAVSKDKWIKFANTLKLRIFLHYSAKDQAYASQQITALVNSGAKFMESPADNFQMAFLAESQRQNPLYSMENGQFKNQFFPNRFIVNLMNGKSDPRRSAYFIPFPFNSSPATFKGASVLDTDPSSAYSRNYQYIYGTPSAPNTAMINPDGSLRDGAITFSGAGPARLLTFAEYNFIRAEAALLYGAPGNAQSFFEAGIRASMTDAGVAAANVTTYLATQGTLTGTNQQKLEQIITEKYVANHAVLMEPWTDYRRTGYPALTPHKTPMAIYDEVPRSLFYAQSEINNNPNAKQKASMLDRVFWDTRK